MVFINDDFKSLFIRIPKCGGLVTTRNWTTRNVKKYL